MSYKNFKSKFNVLCEENTERFKNGGVLMGDFVKILPSAVNHPKIKERPANFLDKIKEFIKSGQHLKVSVVKTDKPATSNGLVTAGEAPDGFWVDVVREYAPGLFADVITLPIEVIEVITPECNNWSPDQPEDLKYDNKLEINGKPVKDAEGDLEHQTQGSKRKTATKDTKGITKGTAKGAKGEKPVEYKESVDVEKTDTELLVEAYGNVVDPLDREDKKRDIAVGAEPSFREKITSRKGELGSEPEVIPDEEGTDGKNLGDGMTDGEFSEHLWNQEEDDIFEKYGTYAKHFDGLATLATQRELTTGEKHFFNTFQALLNDDATVAEMKAAHKDWHDEDNETEADKVRNTYLNIQAKKV